MQIFSSIPTSLPKTALTLGSFDGVHLGHQVLFQALKETNSTTTVITFTNSPLQILSPDFRFSGFLCSLEERLSRIEKAGMDFVICLPFTQEIARLSYEDFLSPFSLSHLILGEGAAFGARKQGTAEAIRALAKQRHFQVHYLPKLLIDGAAVSSRRIREAILKGDLILAERLLGRPFSLRFPAYLTEITDNSLCLPPDGTYQVLADEEELLLTLTTCSQGKKLHLSTSLKQPTLLTFITPSPPRGLS